MLDGGLPGSALAWMTLLLVVLTPLALILSALLDRSGPIRLRHWGEEVPGRLGRLYAAPRRFDGFRYSLNLVAKLAPVALCLSSVAWLDRRGAGSLGWVASFLGVVLLVGAVELANRLLVRSRAEEMLEMLTPAFRIAAWALAPFTLLAALVLPERNDKASEGEEEEPDDEASEREIEAFIDVGTEEGILEPGEEEMVWRLVDFGDSVVRSVMTSRIDMVCAPADLSLEDLAALFVESRHSRIPIFHGSIDRIVGIVHIRDLLGALRAEQVAVVRDLVKPAFFVSEDKPLAELLRELQARHQQMAIVLDEYGGVAGLVTAEDLVEEIVGEIVDEDEQLAQEAERLPDGSFRVDGRAHHEVLEDLFDVELEDGPFETVGGLVSSVLGYVPKPGEGMEFGGLRFTVEQADQRRIQTVRVERASTTESQPS